MKVLFVSATLPPEGMATAGIIGNLMLEMKKMGVYVDGLTFKNSMNDLNSSKWNEITIFHADYVREYGYKWQSVEDFIFKIKRKAVDVLRLGDKYPYKELAVDALVETLTRMNADTNYDCIIAAAAFYDSVEAVIRYKKSVKGIAKYVFYQLDPLQENLAFKAVNPNWMEGYEKSLYSQYDLVFTTREIFQLKENKKWMMDNVVAVDYPCVNLRMSNFKGSKVKKDKEIRCVYAGQLNDQIRDATKVLEILSSVNIPNISFYFIGEGQASLLQSYCNGLLKDRLHILGRVPERECEHWISSADFLLIIGNNVSNQIPSKVFSYMSYGIPIIATCKSRECPARRYLQMIPNALIIDEFDDVRENIRKIEEHILNYMRSRLSLEQINSYASMYTPEKVACYMLENITGGKCE